MDDVDIELCREGGFDVGWISDGEWISWDVTVKESGKYLVEIRVSRLPEGFGVVHFSLDDIEITGRISIPSTGGWQEWELVSESGIAFKKGEHVLKLVTERGSFNINWIRFLKE